MEREGAKLLEGRVARLILLVVVSMMCVVFCILPSNRQLEMTVPFFSGRNFSSFQLTAGQLYNFFFPVVIFSGCNLNPLKNIAGQTTVGFFFRLLCSCQILFLHNYDLKKKVQSSVAVGRNDNYDLKKKVQLSPRVRFTRNCQIFTRN